MENPKILSQAEIEQALPSVSGWSYGDDKLTKEFKFADFMESLTFINSLVNYFEKMDHHPDVHIYYSRVVFELQRGDSGGKVTDRDIEVAKEINKVFEAQK